VSPPLPRLPPPRLNVGDDALFLGSVMPGPSPARHAKGTSAEERIDRGGATLNSGGGGATLNGGCGVGAGATLSGGWGVGDGGGGGGNIQLGGGGGLKSGGGDIGRGRGADARTPVHGSVFAHRHTTGRNQKLNANPFKFDVRSESLLRNS